MRKVLNLIIIISMLFVLTGCSTNTENVEEKVDTTSKTTTTSSNVANSNSSTQKEKNNTSDENNGKINYKEAAERQMSMPEEGETIAVFKIKKIWRNES